MYYILSMDISVAGGITHITLITPIIPIKNSFIFPLIIKKATPFGVAFYIIYNIYYLRFLLFTMSSSLIMCWQSANLSTTNNT